MAELNTRNQNPPITTVTLPSEAAATLKPSSQKLSLPPSMCECCKINSDQDKDPADAILNNLRKDIKNLSLIANEGNVTKTDNERASISQQYALQPEKFTRNGPYAKDLLALEQELYVLCIRARQIAIQQELSNLATSENIPYDKKEQIVKWYNESQQGIKSAQNGLMVVTGWLQFDPSSSLQFTSRQKELLNSLDQENVPVKESGSLILKDDPNANKPKL